MHLRALAAALAALSPAVDLALTDVPPGALATQTWTLANSPYRLTGDVVVQSGATLTIEAGVEIRVAVGDAATSGMDTGRTELAVDGTLVANGTPGARVRFVPEDTVYAGRWYGIVVRSGGAATLAEAEIVGGLNCLDVQSTGVVLVTGGLVSSCQVGVYGRAGAPSLISVEIANSTASGIYTSGGGLTASGLLVRNNGSNGIFVGNGALSLQRSVIRDNAAEGVTASASSGTYAANIVRNTIAHNGGDGIHLSQSGGTLTLDVRDNIIAWNAGGYGVLASGLPGGTAVDRNLIFGETTAYSGVTASWFLSAENPLFMDEPARDLRITSRSPARLHASNGGDLGAYDWAGDVTPILAGRFYENATLTAAASPHDVLGTLKVEAGVTLTIEPGATLRFATTDVMAANPAAAKPELLVFGTLVADGTVALPIAFQSAAATPAPGDWLGVSLSSTSTASLVRHVIISNASGGLRSDAASTTRVVQSEILGCTTGILVSAGATVFDGVVVHGSTQHGVSVNGGSPSFRNMVVHHNTRSGIVITTQQPAVSIEILHATVAHNGEAGLYANRMSGGLSILARNSIFASNGTWGVQNYLASATITADHDDVWGNTSGGLSGVTPGAGSLAVNPQFVDAAAGDYRLAAGSPLVDGGIDTGLTVDALGNGRNVDGDGTGGALPDLGAYESPAPGNLPPTAVAGPDVSATVGQVVSFDGTSSSDPDGSIASWSWDFGDGSSAATATATHAFAAAGDFNVTLTVTDDAGATAQDVLVVHVTAPPPPSPPPQNDGSGGGGCTSGAGAGAWALVSLALLAAWRRRR